MAAWWVSLLREEVDMCSRCFPVFVCKLAATSLVNSIKFNVHSSWFISCFVLAVKEVKCSLQFAFSFTTDQKALLSPTEFRSVGITGKIHTSMNSAYPN